MNTNPHTKSDEEFGKLEDMNHYGLILSEEQRGVIKSFLRENYLPREFVRETIENAKPTLLESDPIGVRAGKKTRHAILHDLLAALTLE